MNGRERILALLEGRPVDGLPCMPITMQFAAARIGATYRDYATDYRVLFEFALEMEVRFAREQVAAGAELIGVGDAAASLVGPGCEVPRDTPAANLHALVDYARQAV